MTAATKIRGNWPAEPAAEPPQTPAPKAKAEPKLKAVKPAAPAMKLISEDYAPSNHQFRSRGDSIYNRQIEYLMSGEPGKLAVECTDQKLAIGIVHALTRHLKHSGQFDTLRPRLRKDSPTSVKVWVVRHAKAQ